MEKLNSKDLNCALYGLVLGDGSYRNGSISASHTNKQRFYVEWLEKLLTEQGLDVKVKYDFIKKTTFGDYMYSSIKINTPERHYYEDDGVFFDCNKKKIISDHVLNNINELGLLFWFLDDGHWHVSFKQNGAKRFGYLNTQSFTYEENAKILEMFKRRFDIDLRIHTDTSPLPSCKGKIYYRLYFNATNFRKFFDLLRPYLQYIPEEFYYKFNMQYIPNRMKNSLEYSKKYNLTQNLVHSSEWKWGTSY